jgi:hypothetical protein
MPEAATGAAAAAPGAGAAPPAPASAGSHLASVPSGAWFNDFKSEEVRTIVSKFKSPEELATGYFNLEKMKGVPDERLLRLPEKLEGDVVRPIFEKLGMPKEPKGYELPRDEKTSDPKFLDWAEGTFHKNHLTKAQAQGMQKAYDEYAQAQRQAQTNALQNSIMQAEEKLKGEWGASYEQNVNLAKQGAKILGMDAKTLDTLEMLQGRETLYKTLQRIGVGVGESTFVDGSGASKPELTQEQAQAEMKQLMTDQKFQKQFNKGSKEAIDRWTKLNQLAAPGEKQIS